MKGQRVGGVLPKQMSTPLAISLGIWIRTQSAESCKLTKGKSAKIQNFGSISPCTLTGIVPMNDQRVGGVLPKQMSTRLAISLSI